MLVFVHLFIVLAALFVGSRFGSLALAAISGIALAILVMGFGLTPGNPPTDVIFIIVAAVTCAGMLQAAGGMDWLIRQAEKLLRKHPSSITLLAPFCAFFLTVLVGTGHVIYTLMPIIVDVALKNGIRPERPCAVASVASQVGITCSPIAAAVVSFVVISGENGFDITVPQVIMVTLPSCFIGVLVAALCSLRRGKDLDKDPEFLAKMASAEQRAYINGESSTLLDSTTSGRAGKSVAIFFAGIVAIVLLGAFGNKAVNMSIMIQIVMLVAAALMILVCKADPIKAVNGKVWQNGMVAVVAIYGIAWMSDTFVSNNIEVIQSALGGFLTSYPWAIALVFFAVSVMINSQGATVVAILPLAYSLGVPGYILLGALPSVYGYFFIPNYPSDIATVNFDRSGTTRIGKYLINNSFMMPGLVSVSVSTIVGIIMATLLFK